MRTSLHREVVLKASPARIYDILLSSKLFTAFSMFGGQIVGRDVALVPAQRIVQAWRPAHWDEGVYSIARFALSPRDATCLVVLDHYGFPQGEYDHLSRGWKAHYWDRLEKFLA